METRKENASFVRAFALSQFDKFQSPDNNNKKDEEQKGIIEANIKAVKQAYGPRRKFKRADEPPKDEVARVKSTLLEYGVLPMINIVSTEAESSPSGVGQGASDIDGKYSEVQGQILHLDEERLSASAVGSIVGLQAQEIVQVSERYASLSIDAGVCINFFFFKLFLGLIKYI